MGAIAVFISSSHPEPTAVVQRMADAVGHRGELSRAVSLEGCAMAIRSRPDRPDAWIGEHDGLLVAATGSIDNLREIFPANTGEPGSDPVALLAELYRRYGADLPNRLRGVFAVAISDGRDALCFRDHVGYRPLFYRQQGDALLAASEAKQVVAGAGIPREPDLDAVERIFYRDLDDETPAALQGVSRLPKSSSLLWNGQALRRQRYWEPEGLLETGHIPDDEIQPRFDKLMSRAVGRCLTGQDGISLSGGIDSPAVAAFAAPLHMERFNRPLVAISVVYPRYPEVDESRFVVPLAESLGIPLYTHEQHANALADLDRWVSLADTPYPGAALAEYEEDYRFAADHGVRSLMTGEHAEFVFAMQWFTMDHFLSHGRLGAARQQIRQRRARGESWVTLARFAARAMAPDRLMAIRNAFSRRTSSLPTWLDARRFTDDRVSVRERWRHAQLAGFIGPGISLEAEEVCQDVVGVRSRKPWTDVDLWEFFLSMPAEQKFPDLRAKGLVRDLLRTRVPNMILDRTDKTVFDAAAMATVDYAALDRYLLQSPIRIGGVDYALLRRRIKERSLSPIEYRWTRSLATVHAFLGQWA